jgi:uncharacterized damage-inducible protein DinB
LNACATLWTPSIIGNSLNVEDEITQCIFQSGQRYGREWILNTPVRQAIANGLFGEMAHVSPEAVFDGLDWTLVSEKPTGAPHSVWDILQHVLYWQDYCLKLLRGENPSAPEHASESWACTERPLDEQGWHAAVSSFLDGLSAALEAAQLELSESLEGRPEKSRVEVLQSLIGHNSYHLGQVVLLRQLLGSWPPPSGGDTW